MLTVTQSEQIAKDSVELTKTMRRLIKEQFRGAGPGVSRMNDAQFMGWVKVNLAYHGPAFFLAVAKVPGGMREIDRFERITRTGKYAEEVLYGPTV